ncbi:unnamed protein product [marine sediment metagenome]|uniref:Uncharacterized protein n=1 Tax=marine sediment metagenome TaxID=412755 RepID=X1RSU3_9ZZZZ
MSASEVSIVCRWVKACAASQAKYKVWATKSLESYGRVDYATILGPLLFGSLLTGALFFYWLNVTANLLPGKKRPAVLWVNKKTLERKKSLGGIDKRVYL